MTKARYAQVSLEDTPFYHCYTRCVRRAFLCGFDRETGNDFEHRRQWIVDRLKRLASIFCLDICAYAVMSNHYHVVLRVDVEEANRLSDISVLKRWRLLFAGDVLVERYLSEKQSTMDDAEKKKVHEIAQEWRNRLTDISWFMRCLNESIARMANKEDGCKGRFWEGRFKSQALLDEVAVLACMTYVDLNPVRAGIAETPESSDFTSIQERIRGYMLANKTDQNDEIFMKMQDSGKNSRDERSIDQKNDLPTKPLLDLFDDQRAESLIGMTLSLKEYMQLVDWTGRTIIKGKRGSIPDHLPSVLLRLKVNPENWVTTVSHFNSCFPRMAGQIDRLKAICQKLNLAWVHGMRISKRLFDHSVIA